ncbi:MAG: hypothetical protein OEM97_08510 [Acidimicrobiia bacterium]|nr:hypothetical protein [Acidimicrobiia bacterium]
MNSSRRLRFSSFAFLGGAVVWLVGAALGGSNRAISLILGMAFLAVGLLFATASRREQAP